MNPIWKLKLRVNKCNKQINLTVPKKQLPPELRKLLIDKPNKIKLFKLRYKGYE